MSCPNCQGVVGASPSKCDHCREYALRQRSLRVAGSLFLTLLGVMIFVWPWDRPVLPAPVATDPDRELTRATPRRVQDPAPLRSSDPGRGRIEICGRLASPTALPFLPVEPMEGDRPLPSGYRQIAGQLRALVGPGQKNPVRLWCESLIDCIPPAPEHMPTREDFRRLLSHRRNFQPGGDFRATTADSSIIWADGDVSITGAENCLIIATGRVRITSLGRCLIIAGQELRLTGASRSFLMSGGCLHITTVDRSYGYGKEGVSTTSATNLVLLNDTPFVTTGSRNVSRLPHEALDIFNR